MYYIYVLFRYYSLISNGVLVCEAAARRSRKIGTEHRDADHIWTEYRVCDVWQDGRSCWSLTQSSARVEEPFVFGKDKMNEMCEQDAFATVRNRVNGGR